MGVAYVGLVHCGPCKCKIKGFCATFSIERNVSKKHLRGVRQLLQKMGIGYGPWSMAMKMKASKTLRRNTDVDLEQSRQNNGIIANGVTMG